MRAIVIALLLGAGCTGAKSAEGECLGFSCDEEGAKAMMRATLDGTYQPSETALAAFETVMSKGTQKMASQQGFTPDSFQLAKDNLQTYLSSIPENGVDPLTPALEDLGKGTAKVCSLWPYC